MRLLLQRTIVSTALIALAACGGGSDSGPATTGNLSGSVLNAPNPVSGVKVVLTGSRGTFTTTTTASGTYDLRDVPTGTYSVDFCGDNVFDQNGAPIADKIDLRLPRVVVVEGTQAIGGKPQFLPEEGDGVSVDTADGLTATIAAGTVIANTDAGVSIVFNDETTVTFPNEGVTKISITEVPMEQIPVSLPDGVAGVTLFAIEPAGATLSHRPTVRFPNSANLPIGSRDIPLYRLGHSSGTWDQFGVAAVSVDGNSILSDAGEGLTGTGWHVVGQSTFCTTNITGVVEDGAGSPVVAATVTTINGLSATTDTSGAFTFTDVPLAFDGASVVATALPLANTGLLPNDSASMMGACGQTTDVGTIVLNATAVDMTAPTVTSTVPADGATGVADNISISVTFDDVMSPGSLNPTNLSFTVDGQSVTGQFGYNFGLGQTTVTFLPAALLPLDATCAFSVGTGVVDAAGNALETAYDFSFETVGTTSGGTPSVDVTPDAPAAMMPGDTQQMSAAASDAASNVVAGAIVSWNSSDPSVASVDATGLVTANSSGTATITGAFGAASDSSTITVNTPAITSIFLSSGSSAMAIGSSQSLVAQPRDAGQNPLLGFTLDWTSSNPAIATVDASGNITAVAEGGPVTITVEEPNSMTTADFAVVVVDPANAAMVDVMPPTVLLGTNTSEQLTAIAYDSGQNELPGTPMNWSSSDSTVASVTANGLVTATGVGQATITASPDGIPAVQGTSLVDTFANLPVGVTVLGGDDGTEPVAGVEVFLNNPQNGLLLQERTTNVAGVAEFDLTGTERVTLSIRYPNEVGEEASLLTLHGIETGLMTFTLQGADSIGSFDLTATTVPQQGNGARVELIRGGYSESDSIDDGSYSGTILLDGASIADVQTDGLASYVVQSFDLQTGVLLGAGFLLDQDPTVLLGSQQTVPMSSNSVTVIPFTANADLAYGEAVFARNGLLFELEPQVSTPTTSGDVITAIPTGSDRMQFSFFGPGTSGIADVSRSLGFASQPSTISVTAPVLEIPSVSFDGQTQSVTASFTGSDASDLDFWTFESTNNGQSGEFRWTIVADTTSSTISLPQLPSSSSAFGVDSDQLDYGVHAVGFDSVVGYDAFIAGIKSRDGNFDKFVVSDNDDTMEVERNVVSISVEIIGVLDGTVTVDAGAGAVTVSDGDVLQVPRDVPVLVTANAAMGNIVDTFTCTFGTPTGVGTASATCAFDAFGPSTVAIEFD